MKYVSLFCHFRRGQQQGIRETKALPGQTRLNYSNVLRYRNINMINV